MMNLRGRFLALLNWTLDGMRLRNENVTAETFKAALEGAIKTAQTIAAMTSNTIDDAITAALAVIYDTIGKDLIDWFLGSRPEDAHAVTEMPEDLAKRCDEAFVAKGLTP